VLEASLSWGGILIDTPVAREQGHDYLDYEADCPYKDHGK